MKNRVVTGNPHYNAEKWGLSVVDEIQGDEGYSFDMVVVWQDVKSNKYYYGHDSGCSCPSPFEDYHSMDDLGKLNQRTFHGFKEAVTNLYSVDKQEAGRFISKWKQKIFEREPVISPAL